MKPDELTASNAPDPRDASIRNRGFAVFAAALLLAGAFASRFAAERNARPIDAHSAHVTEPRNSTALPQPLANADTHSTGATQSRDDRLLNAALRNHLEALARSGDPHQRVIALRLLLLSDGGDTPVARRNAQRIVRQLLADSPGDELLALVQTWFCDPAPAGCPTEAIAAWARTAPDNAAAWLEPLSTTGKDAARVDDELAHAAQATRYDSQARTFALETVAAFDDLQLPPLGANEQRALSESGFGISDAERRRFVSMTYMFAAPLPPFQSILRNCRPPLSAARTQWCHAILLRMTGTTSLLERLVAVLAMERLTRGTREGANWAGQLRTLRWMNSHEGAVATDANYWQDFLRVGEVEALRRALIRAGIPTQPPSAWRST